MYSVYSIVEPEINIEVVLPNDTIAVNRYHDGGSVFYFLYDEKSKLYYSENGHTKFFRSLRKAIKTAGKINWRRTMEKRVGTPAPISTGDMKYTVVNNNGHKEKEKING